MVFKRKTDEEKIAENIALFKKVGIDEKRLYKELGELMKDRDPKISAEALRIYEKLIGKPEKCWVLGCNWRYNLDTHHINKERNDNDSANLIKLCPNHHYLHHRNKIRLEDLSKFI